MNTDTGWFNINYKLQSMYGVLILHERLVYCQNMDLKSKCSSEGLSNFKFYMLAYTNLFDSYFNTITIHSTLLLLQIYFYCRFYYYSRSKQSSATSLIKSVTSKIYQQSQSITRPKAKLSKRKNSTT